MEERSIPFIISATSREKWRDMYIAVHSSNKKARGKSEVALCEINWHTHLRGLFSRVG